MVEKNKDPIQQWLEEGERYVERDQWQRLSTLYAAFQNWHREKFYADSKFQERGFSMKLASYAQWVEKHKNRDGNFEYRIAQLQPDPARSRPQQDVMDLLAQMRREAA